MTLDEMRAMYEAEKPFHPEWPSSFGLVLAQAALALLEFYHRHPQSRRSARAPPLKSRTPDWRPRPKPSKTIGFDQKRLASGEKPDDD